MIILCLVHIARQRILNNRIASNKILLVTSLNKIMISTSAVFAAVGEKKIKKDIWGFSTTLYYFRALIYEFHV